MKVIVEFDVVNTTSPVIAQLRVQGIFASLSLPEAVRIVKIDSPKEPILPKEWLNQ